MDESKYYIGESCSKGHDGLRYKSTRQCVTCNKERYEATKILAPIREIVCDRDGCNNIIVTSHARRKYCSTKCRQAVISASYRNRNSEELKKSTLEYHRRIIGYTERNCRLCGRHIISSDKSESDICQTCWLKDRTQCRIRIIETKVNMALSQAGIRARKKGIECSITLDDLYPLPEVCPILGIELNWTNANVVSDASPTIDRKDNSKGYIPGNVWWVSHVANTMKRNADPSTLVTFAKWVLSNYEDLDQLRNSESNTDLALLVAEGIK